MIKSFLSKIEQTESASELCIDISILGAIYLMSKAWNDTKDSTIEKYFRLARFSTDNNSDVHNKTDETEEDADEDDIPLIHLFLDNSGSFHMNMISSLMPPSLQRKTQRNGIKTCWAPVNVMKPLPVNKKRKNKKEKKKLSTMSELETLL